MNIDTFTHDRVPDKIKTFHRQAMHFDFVDRTDNDEHNLGRCSYRKLIGILACCSLIQPYVACAICEPISSSSVWEQFAIMSVSSWVAYCICKALN